MIYTLTFPNDHSDVGYSEPENLMLVAEQAAEIRVLRGQGKGHTQPWTQAIC